MTLVRRAPSRVEEKRRHRDARRTLFLSAAAGVIGVMALGMAVGNSFTVPMPQDTFEQPPIVIQPTPPLPLPGPPSPVDVGPPVTAPVTPSSLPGLPSVAARTSPARTSPPRATQGAQQATTTVVTTTTASEPATTETVTVTPPPPPPPQPTEPTETPEPDPCLTDQPPLECLPVIPEETASDTP